MKGLRPAGLLGALIALSGCDAPAPPNVLLITVDTLRADRLGAFGNPDAPSPAIDALLRTSASFRTALVPRGQTWPTLASVLSSRYPVTHGVRRNGQRPDPDLPTLGTHLSAAGWDCAAVLGNSAKAEWPGFETTWDLRDRDEEVQRQAIRWLRRERSGPFLLWVHYFGPHRPYDPPASLRERYDPFYDGTFDGSIERMREITANRIDLAPEDLRQMLARYDGEVTSVDRLVGRLLGALREIGEEERTIVVFTSDHGEELYERNHYFSHSASIYDTVLRVPLAFRWPGAIEPAWKAGGIAEVVDVTPTVTGLLGLEALPGSEGKDLGPVLRGEPLDPERRSFAELEDRVVSLRSMRHRYVHNPTGFGFPLRDVEGAVIPIAPRELYDHRDDAGERVNLAEEEPGVVRELEAAVAEWQRAHDWDAAGERHRRREVPEDLKRSLEALGYVR